MDDPNADTEWNDILRAKGILPPKPKEAEVTEEELEALIEEAVRKRTGQKRVEDMNLDELDEIEDDFDDEEVLEKYRQQRLAELREKMAKAKFGSVLEISKPDYIREVNQAGEGVWVVLHLYNNSVPDSRIVSHHMNILAAKFPATKFVSIVSTRCIENYPDKNLPSVFIYRDGEMRANLIGPAVWGDVKNIDSVEYKLAKAGAIDSALEADPAARRGPVDVLEQQLRHQRDGGDDDEEDW